jgi:ribosomal protein S18 acetylase RimI-like enzyme
MKPLDSGSLLQQSLILEPGTEAMFDELAQLHNIVDSYDNSDHVDISGSYFRTSYSFPGIVLSRNVILGRTLNGLLVASGTILPSNTSPPSARISIQVHPDYRCRGFGSKILKHLLQRAVSFQYETAECRIFTFRQDAIHFAERHSFLFDQVWIKMQLDCKFPIEFSIIPTELNIRELDIPGELGLWAQLQNAIFEGSPDYEETSRESLLALTKHEGFDPNLVIVGEVNGTPVGFCVGLSFESSKNGETQRLLQIHGLGVLSKYRGKGYGQALLAGILNRACFKGHKKCELLVHGSNIRAFGLYTKFGFRERYGHLLYKRSMGIS